VVAASRLLVLVNDSSRFEVVIGISASQLDYPCYLAGTPRAHSYDPMGTGKNEAYSILVVAPEIGQSARATTPGSMVRGIIWPPQNVYVAGHHDIVSNDTHANLVNVDSPRLQNEQPPS
jgi:hypothetical protein